MNFTSSSPITLNVGGTEFQCFPTTLKLYPYPNFLKSMIDHAPPTQTLFFVDRDPKHFHFILNHIRSLTFLVPDSVSEMQELYFELDYYCLQEYKEHVQKKIQYKKQKQKLEVSRPICLQHTDTINQFLKYIMNSNRTIVDREIFRENDKMKIVFFMVKNF
tara:strand:+ start:341 stop:823 length:483 start_codon:yes stop_codon:yes gene_type:complete